MWELLQNASDLGDDISVEFELNQDSLIFRHNGPPFSLEEAYNLIVPDSGKDDDEIKQAEKSVIGQFGTGFISTHILSSNIGIQGIVEDEGYHNFFFELDRRERTDRDYLMRSIIESEKQYAQSLNSSSSYEVSKDMNTAFSYDLHQSYEGIDGQEVVAFGMEFFEEIIPFVMAFRGELSQVKTIDKRQSSSFPIVKTYVTNWLDKSMEGLYLIEIVCTENAQIVWKRIVGSVVQDETEIAFLLEQVTAEQYRFMPYPQICPSLFCAFPMIGSEFFTFPVVINSPSFSPNRERDGIELSIHDQGV